MRWKITNTNTVVGGERIKNTNKKLYVTVGDIVGMGKSASEAVKNAMVNVKTLITGLQQDPALAGQVAGATLIQNLLNPLYVVIKGTEIYQKLMAVADVVTPIVKLIARGTGVWCSPGNAADIGQIVLGIVNEILVGLITSIIVRLKNWIWNYEFLIKDINTMSSEEISKILEKLSGDLKAEIEAIFNGTTAISTWMNGDTLTKGTANFVIVEQYKDEVQNEVNKYNSLSSIQLPGGTAQALANTLLGKQTEHHGPYWVSEYEVPNAEKEGTKRYFRGSLSDGGIQYSDDGGNTWVQSEQKTKSFNSFAKINIGTDEEPQYRYLAGSVPYIKEENLISIVETDWQRGEGDQFSKDYYKYNAAEKKTELYTKFEKDSNDKYYYIARETKGCFDASDYTKGDGVYRSDDNGLNWTKCNCSEFENIGKLWEFKEKFNGDEDTIPSRVVACDYDYKGVWYTEDGDTFSRSQVKRTDAGELEDITYGRWVDVRDYENDKVHGHTSNIDANATIQEATVSILVHPTTANIASTASIKIVNFKERLDELYGDVWRKIRNLIHENYDIAHPYYSEVFWKTLRNKVFKGEYTLEDYNAGTDLQYHL